jgi:hypothetical protein
LLPPAAPERPPSRFVNGESGDDELLPAPLTAPVSVVTRPVSGAAGLDEEPVLPFEDDPGNEPTPSALAPLLSRLVTGASGLLLPCELEPFEPPPATEPRGVLPSSATTGASKPPELCPLEPTGVPFEPPVEPLLTPLPLPLPLLLPIVIGMIGTLMAPTFRTRFAIGLIRPPVVWLPLPLPEPAPVVPPWPPPLPGPPPQPPWPPLPLPPLWPP